MAPTTTKATGYSLPRSVNYGNRTRITNAFKRFINKNELGPLRFQDLRHTHATLLLRDGIYVKVVSERLGHASVAITLDTYAHVLPGMQAEAAQRLDSIMEKALGQLGK